MNQSLEDQFLRWRQDMEAKQEEQARQMAKLKSRADHLQQENDYQRDRLEGERIENARGSSHPAPLVKQNKGKKPIRPEDSDAAADDELSSGSSPFLDLTPPKNNVKAESRKRTLRCSSRSVSGMPRRVWREFSRERWQLERAHENMLTRLGGAAPPFGYPTFGAVPVPYMTARTTIRGVEDMLSSPLGQHILSYESPRGFAIPPFVMYDGSSNP